MPKAIDDEMVKNIPNITNLPLNLSEAEELVEDAITHNLITIPILVGEIEAGDLVYIDFVSKTFFVEGRDDIAHYNIPSNRISSPRFEKNGGLFTNFVKIVCAQYPAYSNDQIYKANEKSWKSSVLKLYKMAIDGYSFLPNEIKDLVNQESVLPTESFADTVCNLLKKDDFSGDFSKTDLWQSLQLASTSAELLKDRKNILTKTLPEYISKVDSGGMKAVEPSVDSMVTNIKSETSEKENNFIYEYSKMLAEKMERLENALGPEEDASEDLDELRNQSVNIIDKSKIINNKFWKLISRMLVNQN